jgi:hypothetical protein
MNHNDCITCYAKLSGEEVSTCHKCLVRKYELIMIDWVNEILEDYQFDSGFCEQCLFNCQTTKVILCNEHLITKS